MNHELPLELVSLCVLLLLLLRAGSGVTRRAGAAGAGAGRGAAAGAGREIDGADRAGLGLERPPELLAPLAHAAVDPKLTSANARAVAFNALFIFIFILFRRAVDLLQVI